MAGKKPTREQVIEAADAEFRRRGTDRVSIRDILHASGQSNMSTINYYFGGRDGLLKEIHDRRRRELNRAREQRLRDAAAEKGDLTLRDYLNAVIYPLVDEVENASNTSDYARFAARMTQQSDYTSAESDDLTPSDLAIIRGIKERLRPLPDSEIDLRVDMAFTMIVNVIAAFESRREQSAEDPPAPIHDLAATLVTMMEAALKA